MTQITSHTFYHHPQFSEELGEFITHHCNGTATYEESIGNIERLLDTHFYKFPQFTTKHFGLAQGFGAYTVYWLHLAIPNSKLSRTQQPKAYFFREKNNGKLSFLCIDSHITNYKDSTLRKIANKRLEEILQALK